MTGTICLLILSFFVGAMARSVFGPMPRNVFCSMRRFDRLGLGGLFCRWYAWRVYRLLPRCEHCHSLLGLRLETSDTSYHWDGAWDDPLDPNRERLFCRSCAVDHHEYWKEMWDDYYRSRL